MLKWLLVSVFGSRPRGNSTRQAKQSKANRVHLLPHLLRQPPLLQPFSSGLSFLACWPLGVHLRSVCKEALFVSSLHQCAPTGSVPHCGGLKVDWSIESREFHGHSPSSNVPKVIVWWRNNVTEFSSLSDGKCPSGWLSSDVKCRRQNGTMLFWPQCVQTVNFQSASLSSKLFVLFA